MEAVDVDLITNKHSIRGPWQAFCSSRSYISSVSLPCVFRLVASWDPPVKAGSGLYISIGVSGSFWSTLDKRLNVAA